LARPRKKVKSPASTIWGDLRIITINVPIIDLDYIEKFIDETGLVPSRSEYLRVALRNQINRDLKMSKLLKAFIKGELKFDPEKFVLVPGYNNNKPVPILRRLE